MSFDTRNGTRGARQPGHSRLERWGNARMVERLGRRGDRRGRTVVLVTIGKKTGLERRTPVGWFPGEDGTGFIVASASGAPRNPSWYYNIAAHPDRLAVERAGERTDVIAEQLHGAERDAVWQRIMAVERGFARHERITDRVIPVIRLTPRGGEPRLPVDD
ncbi:deazaflavin-dependent oxidoreductase (nitroreductase family) [Agromyces flavus]|uniref:Deazaflavin-dependent oxidoreductase (Nitroreductase family) n=1 Tax=Agromyces flavus TaxID=589382 RepID=A0A1H1WD82_9MICO|nr:nitroreductase/quinone reductase family protein [Agromyces flavus]MCP2366139.1 deazaflavin-dependent oxidoreductase (nitroreductase family) [Agromyces flavus]SDS94661.1 deazaflavin-dependent oxidoreductase, nitroreductase family [Agromyces flavus]